jgi:hypothetical protein
LRQIVETGYFHCDPHPGRQILLLWSLSLAYKSCWF